MEWINVNDKFPENEKDVLICVKRKNYDSNKYIRFVSKAFYTDGNHNTEESIYTWDNCNFDYDEETDSYIIPEGWWEAVDYSDTFGEVDDFVTHWQYLPSLPEED